MINGLAGAGYLISFGYVFMTLREQRNNFGLERNPDGQPMDNDQ